MKSNLESLKRAIEQATNPVWKKILIRKWRKIAVNQLIGD